MGDLLTFAVWALFVPPAAVASTWLAGRLLGARRGWGPLLAAGVGGFALGVVFAGVVTGWSWRTWQMVGLALGLGTILTMVLAVALDLIAPPGSLASGEEAGLLNLGRRHRVRTAATVAGRYRELLGIARTHGLLTKRVDLTDPDTVARLGPPLRASLEEAGGLFVKLGQVASTRTDLLPEALCDELSHLRSHAEPAPADAVRPDLEAALGASVEDVFASFDWTPLASASIAQVYAAVDRSGQQVVVKVRRPGLDVLIERDEAALMELANVLQARTTLGLTVKPAELAQEFIDGVRDELDLTHELANAQALATGLTRSTGVRVPFVEPTLSSASVLVEERVAGALVDDLAAIDAAGHDRRVIADRLLRSMLDQIFTGGVYHADPHPGNVVVEADGTIVLIDLGAVGRLGHLERQSLLLLMVGAVTGDAALVRQGLEQAGVVGDGVDASELDRVIDGFLAAHLNSGQGPSAAIFSDLLTMLAQFGLRPPRWMATLGRTMLTLEGTLRSLDPTCDLVGVAGEELRSLVTPTVGDGSLRDVAKQVVVRQLPRIQRLPQQLDDLMGQAVTGRLTARLSLFGNQRDVDVVTTLVNRMVLAVLAAALGLGSVLLLRTGGAGRALGVDDVLGYTGLAFSSVLTLRIVAGVVRDGRS